MTAVVSRPYFTNYCSIQGIIQSAASSFEGVFRPCIAGPATTDASWQKVVIKKIDDSGHVRRWINKQGEITDQEAKFVYTVHNPSGTLYLDEPAFIVAAKCCTIALVNPAFAVIKTFASVVRLTLAVGVVAVDVLKSFAESGSLTTLAIGAERVVYQLIQDGSCCLAIPLTALGIELGAMIGIFYPYLGRKIISDTEKFFQRGGIKNQYFLLQEIRQHKISSWSDLVRKVERPDVQYLAPCFQPRGTLDPKMHVEIDRSATAIC